MPRPPILKRLLEGILSIGASPDESESRRSGRRVFMLAFILATLLTIPGVIERFVAGDTWVGVVDLVTTVIPVLLLVVIAVRPTSYVATLHLMLLVILAGPVLDSAMFGGLLPSGLLVIFGLDAALGALLAIGLRAGLVWFGVFALSVVYAAAIPHWVDPIYSLDDPTGNAVFNLIATGIVTTAVMIYFVRQRDRFQQRSDDLLHAILPDQIAARLKDAPGTIADDVPSASVLFADVVDFTPMSATMSPAELVGMLDELFTVFDGFVTELGLEKIKTVGDAYMVAAGVPQTRPDHAVAIAELALRIRDHVATATFGGRQLRMRIGVASGPVTAGIIGTHKFAYDLWGDTVNTASRMESSGLPGEIQLAPSSYELLRDGYRCKPRGPVQVKGKAVMITFLLLGRREDAPVGEAD
ncbi:MAG: adenylate/guanylate cyclase domain-containing protein [Actinomycetota bacterium]|nr:adenylate/guanylate cyclase domain-containing protein [Actinomycetota bacterium]